MRSGTGWTWLKPWSGASFCAALLAAGATLGCSDEDEPSDAKILFLSPYTGTSAADGFNREQAMNLLTRSIDTTEITSSKLEFVFFDAGRGADGSKDLSTLLSDESLLAIVGPDNVTSFVKEMGIEDPPAILELLPGISTAAEVEHSAEWSLWLGPSGEEMACTLAENTYDREDYRVAVVYDTQELNEVMAETFVDTIDRYDRFERSDYISVRLDSTTASEHAAFRDLTNFEPDAIVLLTETKTAASLIQDWSAARGNVNWYLGPGVLNEQLLENVPLDQVEGAIGIEPGVPVNNKAAKRFRSTFQDEMGTAPFPSTYYYLDAAVIALASLQAGAIEQAGDREATIAQARSVSTAPGERFEWDELDVALERLRDGEPVDYQGVTGALTIDRDGQIIRANSFDLTRVEEGVIVPLYQDTCI